MNNPMETLHKSGLTEGATAALDHAGFSRRSFLRGAGALIVSFNMMGALAQQPVIRKARAGDGNSAGSPPQDQLDSWIVIAANGAVTAYTGKAEIGQGQWTVQTQLVAEELCVPFSRVTLIACDTAFCPDQGITSGSQSTVTNFNETNLALAAASARGSLLELASKRLGVPADQLVIQDGVISVKNHPAKKVAYGQLVEGNNLEIKVDPNAKRKPASEWTVLGKSVPRPDFPFVVTGQMEYVQNLRLPGMLHGRVVRPPTIGATVVSVDESSVQGIPGLVKVVIRNNFIGVVTEKPWPAIQAATKLKVTWSAGTGLPSHEDFYDYMRKQPTQDQLYVNSKDVDEKLAQASTVVKATYSYPMQMHGSIGTSCAVADVHDGKATLYSATQAVWGMKHTSAILMDLKPEDVHVIFRRGSGCYGLNGADTVTYDAALLSQAVGKPVRVQFSRHDEMGAGENYGFPYVLDERAGLDANGNIVAWDIESWAGAKGGRPGYGNPGNVITGSLVGFSPTAFKPVSPAPEPKEYANLLNGVPPYFRGTVGGKEYGGGLIKAERSLIHNIRSPLFTAPLRGPGRLQNTFATESFMDELAAQAKADPVEFRLRHLKDPRLIDVVKAAAALANWDARPSPKSQTSQTGVVTGRGFSCVAYEGDNGWSAMVADVEVDRNTGRVTAKRMFFSNDVGPISNPNGLQNQIEGGALHGYSRAIGEEVIWDNEKVTSVDWASYHPMPLSFAMPEIKIKLINRPDKEATGAGEFTIIIIAAAIGNAIFDATGIRVRQAPFTPERVRAALARVSA